MGAEPKTRTLKLKNITVDAAIQPRAAGLDPSHVADLAGAYAAGKPVPPGRVVRDPATGTLWLSRGFHRFAGAAEAGLDQCEFEVVSGDRKFAILDAAASAPDHSTLKFSTADKRRAIANVLGVSPDWTDSRVAEFVGVDHKTVAAVRSRLGNSQPDEPVQRVGKDGKTYTMKPKADPKPAPKADPTPDELSANSPDDGPEPIVVEQAGGGDAGGGKDSPPAAAAPPAGQPADPAAESLGRVESLCRDMDQIAARMKSLKADRYCYAIHVDSAVAQVEAARKTLWQGRAAHPCPYCEASGESGCRACNGTTRVKGTTRNSGLEAMGGKK